VATKIGSLYGDVGLNTKPLDTAAAQAKATILSLAKSAEQLRALQIGFKKPTSAQLKKEITGSLLGMKPVPVPTTFRMPAKSVLRGQVAAYMAGFRAAPIPVMFSPPPRAQVQAQFAGMRPVLLPSTLRLPLRSVIYGQLRAVTSTLRPMPIPVRFAIPNTRALRAQLAAAFQRIGPIPVPLTINATNVRTMQRQIQPATSSMNALNLATAATIGGFRGLGRQSAGLSFYSMIRSATAAEGAMAGLSGALANLGTALFVAAGVYALARAFRSMTDVGAEFEYTMLRNKGVLEATSETMRGVTRDLRAFAVETVFGANEAAKGLYYLASAGFDAQQSMAALPQVQNLAVSGFIDMEKASDIAVAAMAGFGYSAEELTRVNDSFVSASNKTLTTVDQMAEAFQYVVPFSRILGYNIEETAGLIGILSDAGARGSKAGTHLAQAMKKAGQIAAEFGFQSSDLVDVLTELENRGATANDVIKLFAQRGALAALILFKNLKQVRSLQLEIAGDVGISERNAAILLDAVQSSAKKLVAVFEDIKIGVFDAFRDELAAVIKYTTSWLKRNKDAIVDFLGLTMKVVTGLLGAVSVVGNLFTTIHSSIRGTNKAIDTTVSKLDTLSSRKTAATIIPPEASGGELMEDMLSGDPEALEEFVDGMQTRAASSEDAAASIMADMAKVDAALQPPSTNVWAEYYSELTDASGVYWGESVEQALTAQDIITMAAMRAREEIAKAPDPSTWAKFWHTTGMIGLQGVGVLERIAKTVTSIMETMTFSQFRFIHSLIHGSRALADLVVGDLDSAARNAKNGLERITGIFTEEMTTFAATAKETWATGWSFVGFDTAARLEQEAFVAEQVRQAEEQVKLQEEARKRIEDTMAAWNKQLGGFSFTGDKKGRGKGLRDLANDAKKLATIYRDLALSGILSSQQLDRAWELYHKARMQQLEAELAGIDKIEADSELMEEHRKQATAEIMAEIARLKKFGDPGKLKAQVDLYRDLAESARGTTATIQKAWSEYTKRRLEQIEFERLADIAKNHDEVTANADAERKKAELAREGLDAIRGHVADIEAVYADHYKSILDDTSSTTKQMQVAWDRHVAYRLRQIDAEAVAMRENLGLNAFQTHGIITEMRRRLFAEKPEELLSMQEAIVKWMRDTATEANDAFSDLFFDAFKGEAKKTFDYLERISDAFMRRLTDRMADTILNFTERFLPGNTGFTQLNPGTGGGGGGFDIEPAGGAPTSVTIPQPGTIGEDNEGVIPLSHLRDQRFLEGLGEGQRDGTTGQPVVNMTVNTPDVAGFQRSKSQVMSQLSVAMRQAMRNN
jgi:TP901 family phage tail tape measure protein